MVFTVYLKDDIGNQLGELLGKGMKSFNVGTLSISDGLLTKGDYRIPINHILLVVEVP